MKTVKTILFLIIILSFTHCMTNKSRSPESENFYENYKDAFLKSDLTKYNYDPRSNFTYGDFFGTNFFRVLILPDSSIRVFGFNAFNKLFNVTTDTLTKKDIIISKFDTNNYILTDPNDKENPNRTKIKNTSSVNVVDYFLNLKKLIDKYQILEIDRHPGVNTIKIVFSDHDYLIYKPNTLVFKNSHREFMKYLFKNGKEIDKNWFRFTDKTNTDYY